MSDNNNNTEKFSVNDILNEYSDAASNAVPHTEDMDVEQIITEVNNSSADDTDNAEPPEEQETVVPEPEEETAPEEDTASGAESAKAPDMPEEEENESFADELSDEEEPDPESFKPRKKTRGAAFTMRTSDDGDEGKRLTAQSEYERPEDAKKIYAQILKLKNTLTVRAAVLLFAAVFSLFITSANDLKLPLAAAFDRTINPSAYLFTNTILGIIAVGFSYSVISMGLKGIVSRRADSDSIAAVNIIAAIIAGLATLFEPESLKAGFFHLYTSAAITALLFNTFGKLSIVRRAQRNFEFVSRAKSFSAVSLIDDDDTAAYLTNGSSGKRRELATLRRTAFPEDFMKNSYSSDLADRYSEKVMPLILCASLIVGLLSVYFEKTSASTYEKLFVFLASVSGTLSICSSFALTLVVNLPLARASKQLIDYSGVMLGYSSVEDFAEVNSVVIDSGHLFPTGTVEFVNLKMLGSVMIDDCILYAASMANAGKSVTRPAFYKMLRGELDMMLPVRDCVCEDNMGISGRINSKHMLLGSRKLMEKHGIDGLPSEATEETFACGSRVMYLAVSGRAAMMFAISLSVGPAAERWVQEMEDEAMEIHVRCSDGFITRELISRMFDISASTVKIMPSSCDADYERITEPADRLSASMLCSGHLPTLSMLLISAKRVKFAANLGIAVQYGAMLLGAAISVIMMLAGSFSQITPSIVIIYNLAFLLLTHLMQSMRRV